MKSLNQIFKRLFELKHVTFLNLELISVVLFAIVALVGPMSYVRLSFQAIIVLFMIAVYEYHKREGKNHKAETT